MHADKHQPKTLTYRFHQFRPSDRQDLKKVLLSSNGQAAFVAALELYLQKWADADWLTEYDLERIAEWTSIHAPTTARAVEKRVREALSGAQGEQAKRTYSVMLSALRKHLNEMVA